VHVSKPQGQLRVKCHNATGAELFDVSVVIPHDIRVSFPNVKIYASNDFLDAADAIIRGLTIHDNLEGNIIFQQPVQQHHQTMPMQSHVHFQHPSAPPVQYLQPPSLESQFLGLWKKGDGSLTVAISQNEGALKLSFGGYHGPHTRNLHVKGESLHFSWGDLGQPWGPSHFNLSGNPNELLERGSGPWFLDNGQGQGQGQIFNTVEEVLAVETCCALTICSIM
jgi:hypothetical protein